MTTPRRTVTIDGRQVTDPRHTRAWRTLVARVVLEEPLCWLRLKGCTQTSTTGDHVITVDEAPQLALVRDNVRGACKNCNYRRGKLSIEELRVNPGAAGSASNALDTPPPEGRISALSIFD